MGWCWESTVRTATDALSQWCDKAKRDPADVFVWVCALCNNQEQCLEDSVTAEPAFSQPSEASGKSSLVILFALQRRLHRIGTFLVLLSPVQTPVHWQHAWCLLELYAACITPGCDIRVLLSRADEDSFKGALMDKGLSQMFDLVTGVDAWSPASKELYEMEGIMSFLLSPGIDHPPTSTEQV